MRVRGLLGGTAGRGSYLRAGGSRWQSRLSPSCGGAGAGRPRQTLPAPSPTRPGLSQRPPAPGAPRPRAVLSTEHFPLSLFFFLFTEFSCPPCWRLRAAPRGGSGQCCTGGLCPPLSVHRDRVWPWGPPGAPQERGVCRNVPWGTRGLLRYNFSQIQTPRMKGEKKRKNPLSGHVNKWSVCGAGLFVFCLLLCPRIGVNSITWHY